MLPVADGVQPPPQRGPRRLSEPQSYGRSSLKEFAPSLLLPASRQSGHLPPRGNSTVLRSPLRRATDHSRPHGYTAGRLRRPLPYITSHFTSHFTPQKLSTSQFMSHFTPQKPSTSQFTSHFTPQKPLPTINPHVNCIYPYKCYTVRTNKQ